MERLADEVEEIRNGDPNYEGPGTAASEFARITKEVSKLTIMPLSVINIGQFASMDETLGDISPLHRDEIRPILSRMWRKKSWCSIGLRVLATTISLPEHSTLFDRFNPTIIELFAKSRLVGRKMRSLAEENLLDDLDDEGGETLTDPHPSNDTMPSDEATPAQAIPDTSDLAGLRESILQATDEKQLSKTLLVYVDALESTSIFLAWERRDVSDDQDRVQKRSFAQFEEDFEAKDLKTHLKRYEARLVEREDALQTLRQEIEVRIGDAEKLDIGMKDVKLRLKKHGRRQRPSVRK